MSIREQIELHLTKRDAHRDAGHGVDGGARRQIARFGVDPKEAVKDTAEYRQAVHDVNEEHRVSELADELRRAEDLRAVVGSPWLYNLGLFAVGVIEAVGAFVILQSQGIAPTIRPFAAVALSLTLLAATRAATSVTKQQNARTSLLVRGLVVLGYALLVFAVVTIRVAANEDEEASRTFAFADGILIAAVTMVPALVAAWMETKRAPAAQLAAQIALIRARLRFARRLVERSRKYLERVDRDAVAHTRALARTEALYSVEQDIARAEGTGSSRS